MAYVPIAGKTTTIDIMEQGSTESIIKDCCVSDIGDMNITSDSIDVSCHGSGNFRRKVKGMIDLGTLDVVIMYHDKTIANILWTAVKSNKSYDICINIPNPNLGDDTVEYLKFSAYLGSLVESHPTDDAMKMTVTLGLDGRTAPTWE